MPTYKDNDSNESNNNNKNNNNNNNKMKNKENRSLQILEYFSFLKSQLNNMYHIHYYFPETIKNEKKRVTIDLTNQNNKNLHSFYFYFGQYQEFYLQIYIDKHPLFPQKNANHDYFYSVIPSIYTCYAKDVLFSKDNNENRWNVKIPELSFAGVGMYMVNENDLPQNQIATSITLDFIFQNDSDSTKDIYLDFYVLYNN
jgi:hypothetical protein